MHSYSPLLLLLLTFINIHTYIYIQPSMFFFFLSILWIVPNEFNVYPYWNILHFKILIDLSDTRTPRFMCAMSSSFSFDLTHQITFSYTHCVFLKIVNLIELFFFLNEIWQDISFKLRHFHRLAIWNEEKSDFLYIFYNDCSLRSLLMIFCIF